MFGEGMKVGTLALLREGYQVAMHTSADQWSFQLAFDPSFGERVLTVFVTPRAENVAAPPVPATGASATPSVPAGGSNPAPRAAAVADVPVPGLRDTDTATVVRGLDAATWASMVNKFLFLSVLKPEEVRAL